MEALIDSQKLKQILEAALFAADEPLTIERLTRLFAHGELDSEEGRAQIRATLDELGRDAEGRGYELQRVASGYRYQVRQDYAEWVSRLWEEKPPRYSRALLETLSLIAYKQPVTRGDIEDIRGVAVSQNIMRTLLERNWIRVVGEREVPGRPSLYGTTRDFLDYFNLKSLDQLPPLPEIRALIETMVLEEPVPEAGRMAEGGVGEIADPDEATDPGELAQGVLQTATPTKPARVEDFAGEHPSGGAATQFAGPDAAADEGTDTGAHPAVGQDDPAVAEPSEADAASSGAEIVRLPSVPRE